MEFFLLYHIIYYSIKFIRCIQVNDFMCRVIIYLLNIIHFSSLLFTCVSTKALIQIEWPHGWVCDTITGLIFLIWNMA